MSFVAEVVDAAEPSRLALIAIGRDGGRREIAFGEVADRSARLAGALAARGVARGAVVMTVVGNRPEWTYAMLACWRLGAVALPCTEQLRPADLRARMEAVDPRAVVADERDLELTASTRLERPGDLCWCTAASGWSLSARNAFVAAWLRGAAALLHDARFDPGERLDLIEREGVNVLCMSPTEYRTIAKRAELRRLPGLRRACAAGEPLNPEVVRVWEELAGIAVHDGYGQTETGHLTGMPIGEPVRPGSMGRSLPGFRAWSDDGELVVDPTTVPTFFLDGPRDRPWRTGDRVREDDDGYLWFEGRTDDVIISAGYRIGPFEVESALVSHPAVAEAAAVAAPDDERGQVVRAVVVLRDGYEPGPALATELQEHVKSTTAPYKYPRLVDFAAELPKTPSGKIRRAELRAQPSGSSEAR